MYQRILIATDGSEHSRKAVDVAAKLAAQDNSEVVLVHVLLNGEVDARLRRMIDVEYTPAELDPTLGGEEQGMAAYARSETVDIARHKASPYRLSRLLGSQIVNEAERTLRARGVAHVRNRVLEGDAADEIIRAIDAERPDLVICGARGLSSLSALLMGSVSNKVAHSCAVTCITVH